MSDENRNEKEKGKEVQEESPKLSEQELKKVSGGWGGIKGGSTDDEHKDWSEIQGV